MKSRKKRISGVLKTSKKPKPKYDSFGRREDRLHFLAQELFFLYERRQKYDDGAKKTTFNHLVRELLGLYFGQNKRPGSAGLKSQKALDIVNGKSQGKTVSDHVVPLKILQKCLLSVVENCRGGKKDCVKGIESVLRRNAFVVRISGEEDDRLKKNGLEEEMPDNWKDGDSPWVRYLIDTKAKIVVVDRNGTPFFPRRSDEPQL